MALASVGWAKARSAVPTRSFAEVDQKIAVAVGERERPEKRTAFDLEPPITGQQSFPKHFGGHGASRRCPPYVVCAVEYVDPQVAPFARWRWSCNLRAASLLPRGEKGKMRGFGRWSLILKLPNPLTPPSPSRGEREITVVALVTF